MVKELPGFYYDEEKKKYFRIQPNHAVPAATKYSKQAVDAKVSSRKRRKTKESRHAALLHETVQTSNALSNPLLGQLGLGRLGVRLQRGRFNATTEVAAYYGAGLSRTTLLDYGGRIICNKFDVDELTGALLVSKSNDTTRFRISHHVRQRNTAGCLYRENDYSFIGPTFDCTIGAMCVIPQTRLLAWVTSGSSTEPSGLYIKSLIPPPPHHPSEISSRRDEQGVQLVYVWPETDCWDMAASPSGERLVAASSRGLCLMTLARRHEEPVRLQTSAEYMTVTFKDENVLLDGARNGTVTLRDLRTNTRGVARLRHASGVSAIRAMGNSHVLVRGLKTMSIYDLRFTPQATKGLGPSKPYTTFPGPHSADRFGLGFAYDPTLGLVATAHSSSTTTADDGHGVSLFSTRTRRLVPSPLNARVFAGPVTCLRFADLRAEGGAGGLARVGSGSVLVASGGVVEEWACQGLGWESRLQE